MSTPACKNCNRIKDQGFLSSSDNSPANSGDVAKSGSIASKSSPSGHGSSADVSLTSGSAETRLVPKFSQIRQEPRKLTRVGLQTKPRFSEIKVQPRAIGSRSKYLSSSSEEWMSSEEDGVARKLNFDSDSEDLFSEESSDEETPIRMKSLTKNVRTETRSYPKKSVTMSDKTSVKRSYKEDRISQTQRRARGVVSPKRSRSPSWDSRSDVRSKLNIESVIEEALITPKSTTSVMIKNKNGKLTFFVNGSRTTKAAALDWIREHELEY